MMYFTEDNIFPEPFLMEVQADEVYRQVLDEKNSRNDLVLISSTHTPSWVIAEIFERVYPLIGGEHSSIWNMFAANPNTSAELLLVISKCSPRTTISSVLGNPNTSFDNFEFFISFPDIKLKNETVSHINTPILIVERVALNNSGELKRNAVIALTKRNYHPDWPVEWVEAHYGLGEEDFEK